MKLPISYVLSWIAAVALAFGPLLFDVTRPYALFLIPAILAVVVPIITDQYNSFEHQEKLKKDILQETRALRDELTHECQLAITNAQIVTRFTLYDAHHYVCQNAVRAIRVFNTRLAEHSSEAGNSQYMTTRNMQDEGFTAAIQKGTEYHVVYDITQEAGVKSFCENVMKSSRGQQLGLIHANPVDTRGMPLIQFIVLEYDTYQECLIGYGLGNEIATARDIYLIRSTALCTYLRHVHEHYVRMGVPKQQLLQKSSA